MALFDKVKQQASQVAAKAQEAGKAGQQKLADAQARRKADGMLRELGLAAYSEKAGRGSDATKADIDRLVGELSAYESENGSLADGGPADSAPPAHGERRGPARRAR